MKFLWKVGGALSPKGLLLSLPLAAGLLLAGRHLLRHHQRSLIRDPEAARALALALEGADRRRCRELRRLELAYVLGALDRESFVRELRPEGTAPAPGPGPGR
ncbi:MAG: hypothetical protein ACE5JJ_12360 [Nitrospinota bacterium]